MSDTTDLRPVTFAKEREKILSDLLTQKAIISGMTEDQHQFQFRILSVVGQDIRLETIAPVSRRINSGEPMQALFSLTDGQYTLKTSIEQLSDGTFSIPLGDEVFRLQRRNNFRAMVPSGVTITLDVSSFKTSPQLRGTSLKLIDLSAGGCRTTWPKTLPTPQTGDALAGFLNLPSGKQVEIFCLIAAVHKPDAAGTDLQVGIAFQNVSSRDEQALLFATVQIQRETTKYK